MAIKSSDPRKLQDLDITGNRFEQVVVDAWSSRHEETIADDHPTAQPRTGRLAGRDQADPTHQPFARLGDRLKRH